MEPYHFLPTGYSGRLWHWLVVAVFCAAGQLQALEQNDPACLKLGHDTRMGDTIPIFNEFFDTLYARAGLCTKAIAMTSKRVEAQFLSGEIDGDWLRVEGYELQLGTMAAALPQPVFEMPAQFLWLSKVNFSGEPEDLPRFRVGYPAGFRWIEVNLQKLGVSGIALQSEDSVPNLLLRGRIDIYVTGAMNAYAILNTAPQNAPQIQTAVWRHVPFYHLLHKRHAALTPRLNTVLIDMIKSGEAEKILKIPGIRISSAPENEQP